MHAVILLFFAGGQSLSDPVAQGKQGKGVVDSTGGGGGGVRDSLTAHFSENWVVLNFE